MSKMITFFLMIYSTFIIAGELDNIKLITPISYASKSSEINTYKSKLQVGIGRLIDINIENKVKTILKPYREDLVKYFPSQKEMDSFTSHIIKTGVDVYLGDKLTDQHLILFYRYLGVSLVGGIADKILEKEGIKNPERRKLWIKKLLAPFKTCMSNAKNSQYDADHCMSALTGSLVPSLGVAMVHELAKDSLSSSMPQNEGSAFNAKLVQTYKDCLSLTTAKATDVSACALQSMKTGILNITNTTLTKTVNNSSASPKITKTIILKVYPEYERCINSVGADKSIQLDLRMQIFNCIDKLVLTTGSEVVKLQILSNKTIASNYTNEELVKISDVQVQNFQECIKQQKVKNIRINGILDTNTCEKLITNDMTYNVLIKILNQTANETAKLDTQAGLDMGLEGKNIISQCWSSEQDEIQKENCIRKTILSFSQIIASYRLKMAIPDYYEKKKELTATSLIELQNCLASVLPEKVSKDPDLNTYISSCSNKLTWNIASEVASSQIRSKALGNLSPDDTEQLINKLVKNNFISCLGQNPNEAKLNNCIATLSKDATKTIALAVGKKNIKIQLKTDDAPAVLLANNEQFLVCVDKEYPDSEVSKNLDICIRDFSLGIAHALGELKLNSTLTSVLGSEAFNNQKKSINKILEKYHECLNDLKTVSLDDGLVDKITVCSDSLSEKGTSLVSSNLNTWMDTEEKDAASIMVKNDFANFIPCLSILMPDPSVPDSGSGSRSGSGVSKDLQKNTDSILKPVAILLAQYIEYSPANAKRSLDDIIKQFSTDLKDVASNPASKHALIQRLYDNGTLDQFLKAMIRSEVETSFSKLSEAELPINLRNILLSKDNLDHIFSSKEGLEVKKIVMQKILEPLLMQQSDKSSSEISGGTNLVKNKITKMLVNSPLFGGRIIAATVQNKINVMNGFTSFMAKALYGKDSLNWSKVRTSSAGKNAEDYIRDNILALKFSGIILSKEEENERSAKAEKLVNVALKNYK